MHVSRSEEIIAETYSELFVLWYALEQDDQAAEFALHFGVTENDILQGSHNGIHELMWRGTSVVLINILEKNQKLLSIKPPNLKVLSGKQATSGKEAIYPYSDRTCRWTVIAGDSNLRDITNRWVTTLTGEVQGILRSAPREGVYKNSECEDRWADNEWVMSTDKDCHIITQRFMRNQDAIAGVSNVQSNEYCGTQLVNVLRPDEKRPELPSSVWFGHGLWDLPNEGKSVPDMTCEERFSDVIIYLRKLQASNTQVVWQTNFLIKSHPSITNEYLEWEIQCQKQVAEENGIPLFDIEQLLNRVPGQVSGFHISQDVVSRVADVVDVTGNEMLNHTAPALQEALSRGAKSRGLAFDDTDIGLACFGVVSFGKIVQKISIQSNIPLPPAP